MGSVDKASWPGIKEMVKLKVGVRTKLLGGEDRGWGSRLGQVS